MQTHKVATIAIIILHGLFRVDKVYAPHGGLKLSGIIYDQTHHQEID